MSLVVRHMIKSVWLVLAVSSQLRAQQLSGSAKISLITYAPGDELYAAFGHSALRVRDPATGYDVVFNYGMFSFEEGNFYLKFAQGKLNYWLGTYDFAYLERESRQRNATLYEQIFNLTRPEKQVIFDALTANLQPDNRYYLYDFFYDNCVTRIRDLMRAVLGERLHLDTSFVQDYSFRDLTDQYLEPQPWGDLGIDLALGSRIDRRAPAIDYLFLPAYASQSFATSTVLRAGKQVSLVQERSVLYRKQFEDAERPDYLRPSWIFSSMLGLSILLTFFRWRSQPLYWPDMLLFSIYGLVGIVVLLLWIATNHAATKDNYNLLWLHPLHLISAWLLTRKQRGPGARLYLLIHGFFYLLLLALWDSIPQNFHPAFIPLMVLLAFRYLYLSTTIIPASQTSR